MRDYILNEGLWNFNNRLLLFHPWNPVTQEPLSVFYSTHFNLCITGLPSWCYTPEIALRLASVLEDSWFFTSVIADEEVLGNSSGSGFYSRLKKTFPSMYSCPNPRISETKSICSIREACDLLFLLWTNWAYLHTL